MNTLQWGTLFIATLFAVTAPGVSHAQGPTTEEQKGPEAAGQKEVPRGEQEPKVTLEQAIQAVVAHTPGRVHELEVVHKKGKLVWEVEVITAEGRHFLVEVDGVTGAVTHSEEKSIAKLAGDPTKGKVVFEKHCMACHGPDGKGSGPMGPLLTPPAADYTSESSRAKSDAELLHTIQEGRPGTAMRSFKRWLSKQEMRDVLAYVRLLGRGGKQ